MEKLVHNSCITDSKTGGGEISPREDCYWNQTKRRFKTIVA